MPLSAMGNGSWKKASLLSSLSNRRRDDKSSTRPPRLLASNTVSDIHTTPSDGDSNNGAAPPTTAKLMDDRLVSDLLETTADTDVNSGVSMFGLPAQMRHFARSRTVGAVSSTDASNLSSPPQKALGTGVHIPDIPHKSSRRNLRSSARGVLVASPGGSEDGLVRPLPTSQSVSSHFTSQGTRRLTQSSSAAGHTRSVRYQGDSPIRRGSSSPRKISHSVPSVLIGSQDVTSNIADAANLDGDGPLKSCRTKTKNVFAKFADVLTEHFLAKGSRKGDRPTEPKQTATRSSEKTTLQTMHGQPLSKLSLDTLALPIHDITSTRPTALVGDDDVEEKPKRHKLIVGRAKTTSSTADKRLTVVDEDDFQNGPPLEDPFSESSSGQYTTEFEARLKSGQGSRAGATPTDPFQAENILESSVDAMLITPPVGCSTPRRRPLSLARCKTPTKGYCEPDHVADLIAFSPGMPSTEPERQRKVSNLRGASRKENQPLRDSRNRVFIGKTVNSQPENSTLSDSTRLSSYPPGSTIRHVPRSMARLTEAPTLALSTSNRHKAFPLGKKRHPSPSKGQLELFGKYMEKNLALGVFKDADELGLSFNSPQPGVCTLSPRDSNRLMRNTPSSNVDLQRDYTARGSHSVLPKSRSRIPQPVRQLSRSRTDTAFARDFIPANKGDSTMGDELQWDSPAYKIRPRCNHCGSTSQIV